jgi:hypothetical protein
VLHDDFKDLKVVFITLLLFHVALSFCIEEFLIALFYFSKEHWDARMKHLTTTSLTSTSITNELKHQAIVQKVLLHLRPFLVQLARSTAQNTGCLFTQTIMLVLLCLIVEIVIGTNSTSKLSLLQEA